MFTYGGSIILFQKISILYVFLQEYDYQFIKVRINKEDMFYFVL